MLAGVQPFITYVCVCVYLCMCVFVCVCVLWICYTLGKKAGTQRTPTMVYLYIKKCFAKAKVCTLVYARWGPSLYHIFISFFFFSSTFSPRKKWLDSKSNKLITPHKHAQDSPSSHMKIDYLFIWDVYLQLMSTGTEKPFSFTVNPGLRLPTFQPMKVT